MKTRKIETINKIKKFIVILLACIMLFNFAYSSGQITIHLDSDKDQYNIGEEVNLFLNIDNPYNTSILGQLKGKVIIGDFGYEIQCFEATLPQNQTSSLGLTSLQASFSNSNTKQMQTLYACSGTQMQSTRTYTDNSNNYATQKNEEIFEIEPFTFSYKYNNTDYEAKSNSLNVTVKQSEEQQEEQEEKEQQQQEEQQSQDEQNQQNPQTENSQTQQDSQNNPNDPNSQENQQNPQTQPQQPSLSQQNQNALQNNQQNAQSVNDLKNQINQAKEDVNPLIEPQTIEEQKKSILFWMFILFTSLLAIILIYYKYFKKEKTIEEPKKTIIHTPKYLLLLKQVKSEPNDKEKAKTLSRAVREYLIEKNKLKDDLTNIEAKRQTSNKLFIDILEQSNSIEFRAKNIKLDYDNLVKKLRKEFK